MISARFPFVSGTDPRQRRVVVVPDNHITRETG
jgi:hypothetical protein